LYNVIRYCIVFFDKAHGASTFIMNFVMPKSAAEETN